MLATVALLAVAIVLGLAALLQAAQDRLLYYPVPDRAVAAAQLVLQRPGARVHVSVRHGRGPDAVVYFGGNAEDTSLALDTLAAAWPDASVYAMHYRGYGGSGGRPRERALVGDAQALLDHVRARHGHVSLVGRSLGSGIAAQLAARQPVRQLVLVTPYASIAGLAAERFGRLPVRLLMRDRYDTVAVAPRIQVPTTVIAAGRDEVIPAWSTRQLVDAFAAQRVRTVVIDGVGHNDLGADPRYLQALRAAP